MSSELYRLRSAPPSTLPIHLKDEQLILLHEIALPYAKNGTWPIWHYVVRQMDRRNLDAREIIAALPRVGVTGTMGPSYGFTVGHDWRMLGDSDKVRLTVAAALPLAELRLIVAEPFLRVLHHMIALLDSVEPSPTEVTQTWLESQALAQAIPNLKPEFIAALPEILNGEPATWSGSSSGPNPPTDVSWRKEVRRPVQQYAAATDLNSYIATVCRITMEEAAEQRRMYAAVVPSPPLWSAPALPDHSAVEQQLPVLTEDPVADPHGIRVYAKEELIAELRALDGAGLHTDKLVELLHELNFNVAHEMPLACSCLLRAVIDHVPPGFGFDNFTQVVSSVNWPRTDKKYLERLREFRDQGDDVLHRQMGRRRSRIDMADLPAPAALNALLDGLVMTLRDRQTAAATKP